MAAASSTAPPAHAFLTEPILYLGPGLTQATPDEHIVELLWECLRLRPVLDRADSDPQAPLSGYIQFESLDKAEKALATVAGAQLATGSTLNLLIAPTPNSNPRPTATPRIAKSLPKDLTAGGVFDMFRPFGPIESVTLQMSNSYPGGSAPAFKGTAIITFYEESDAAIATDNLHCSEVNGQMIIVQDYIPTRARKSDLRNGAPQHSPTSIGQGRPSLSAQAPTWTPTRSFSQQSSYSQHSPSANSPTAARRSPVAQSPSSTAGGDPCNLFIKSLDLALTTDHLRAAFEPFGTITSARVMLDELTGLSKGFGFVSFSTAEEANLALDGMNGARLGSSAKPIQVSPHEPKRVREEKLRERFSGLAVSDAGSVDSSARSVGAALPASEPMSPTNSAGALPQAALESPPDSPAPVLSEHERFMQAVSKITMEQIEEVVAMLESLPKKERAMCLFSQDHLKQKVADALLVLNASDEDEPAPAAPPAPAPSAPALAPATTITTPAAAVPSSGPSTLAEFGQLPAQEMMALILAGKTASLGVTAVPSSIARAMDDFMDGLEGQPTAQVKQQLGQKLHKAVKALGVKGAPGITIKLLDGEELRPLAHLINYNDALRAKVLAL